jgi:hypothetical protein
MYSAKSSKRAFKSGAIQCLVRTDRENCESVPVTRRSHVFAFIRAVRVVSGQRIYTRSLLASIKPAETGDGAGPNRNSRWQSSQFRALREP